MVFLCLPYNKNPLAIDTFMLLVLVTTLFSSGLVLQVELPYASDDLFMFACLLCHICLILSYLGLSCLVLSCLSLSLLSCLVLSCLAFSCLAYIITAIVLIESTILTTNLHFLTLNLIRTPILNPNPSPNFRPYS